MTKIELLKAIPKSAWFNFKYLPFKNAIKFPFLISNHVKFIKLKGNISICAPLSTGMIQIGFGNVGIFDRKYSRTQLEILGDIQFNGKAHIGHGSKISVSNSGSIIFGDQFSNSAELSIICQEKITFHKNVHFSWNVLVMDTDFHYTINPITQKRYSKYTKPIVLGENVWIGTRSVILKGTQLPDDCIVGANSVLNKNYDIPKASLIAGNPAQLKKTNITRDYSSPEN